MPANTPLQQLEADLRQCVGGDGVFRLEKNSLSSPAINAIFGRYVAEDGAIAVADAIVGIPVGLDFVLVSGPGAAAPFGETSISAHFTVDANADAEAEAEMVLTATTGDNWNLGVAFPPLSRTDARDLEFSSGSTLVLSTIAQGPIAPGLTFTGTLAVAGPLAEFAAFLPSALTASGAIDRIADGKPQMTLRAPASTPVTIGVYQKLLFAVMIDSTAASGLTLIGIGCELTFGPQPEDGLVIAAEASSEPSIVFIAKPTSTPLGLPQLARLVDGGNAGGVMPTQFPILDKFGFAGWSMSVNPGSGQIDAMSLDVSTIQPWPLAARLVLENLEFGLRLTPGERPPLALGIKAQISIAQKDAPPAVVNIFGDFPAFTFGGGLQPGVPLKLTSIGQFISDDAEQFLPDLAIQKLQISATPPSGSFSFQIVLSTNFPIVGHIVLVQVEFALARLAGAISGRLGGKVDLTGDNKTFLEASAAYNGTSGWLFAGSLTNATLDFGKLAARFFDNFKDVDLGTLHIAKLSLSFNSQSKAWAFYLDATLRLDMALTFSLTFAVLIDIKSGQLSLADATTTRRFLAPPAPLSDEVIARIVEDRLVTEAGGVSGKISGSVAFNNLKLKVTADLPPNGGKPIYTFEFLEVVGVLDQNAGRLTLEFAQPTLGKMVETLVNGAVPGQNFTLSPPWNILNSVPLKPLTFWFEFNTGKQRVGLNKGDLGFEFGFVAIQEISLAYNIDRQPGQPRVEFQIVRGRFLNKTITPADPKKWDVLDPSTAPQTPGQGSSIFDLRFLAVGQHVQPTTPIDTKSVVTAVDSLKAAFKKSADVAAGSSPISGTKLTYADNINWMLGLDATFLGTLTLRAIFLDPELYGVAIALAGDKAGVLKNLKFEILYKKVSDGLGVYQIELTLPDAFRQIELGQVSITLPIIRIWIFTNGDFKVDFGFPENEDFSRSFGVQVLPFTGAGGFYFGVLSGESSSRVPKSNKGNFAPVIELGVGLRIGIGKEINKGILSAGLSVTLQGIVEGAFATFNPYPGESLPENLFFIWIRGKFALVGNLFGEINFAIISARLDITIRLGVSLEMQIYEPVTFGLLAQVIVKLSVKVNLGIFKITIGLSFKAEISAEFTIGSRQTPPWADSLPSARERRLIAARRMALDDEDACPADPPAPNWLRVKPASPIGLPLLVAPQFTAASTITGDVAGPASAQLVTMLYVTTTIGGDLVVGSAFDTIARAALTWAIAASKFLGKEVPLDDVLNSTVTLEDLQLLYCALLPKGVDQPFTSDQVRDFLSTYFAVTIDPAPTTGDDLQASFVPMFPWMTLTRPDKSTFSFEHDHPMTTKELEAIRLEFQKMEVRYRDEAANLPRAASVTDVEASMATFMFVDYFAMLARGTVQLAIDVLRQASIAVEGRSLASLVAAHPQWGVSVEEIAHTNRTRRLAHGITLAIPPFKRRLRHGETPGDIARAHGVDESDLDLHVAPVTPWDGPVAVTVRNARHRVDGSSPRTLLEIARHYGVTTTALATANADLPGLFATERIAVAAIESMTVAALLAQLQATAQFEHLSGLAARVFLQGMRPTWQGEPTALFTISGQQFDASKLVANDRFSLTTSESWIRFTGNSDTLSIAISGDEATLIASFNNATLTPTCTSTVQPYDRVEPKRFTLANAIVWQPLDTPRFHNNPRVGASTQDPTIWMFPDNLQQLLAGDLSLQPVVTVEESTTDPSPVAIDPGPHSWAMTFDAVVRRVHSAANPTTYLESTYDFLGTNDAGGVLLQNFVATDPADRPEIAQIYVLFPPRPGNAPPPLGLTSRPIAGTTFFLVQTNLSTESNPAGAREQEPLCRAAQGAVSPLGQSPCDFLRLAWEASVVRSGGYQLYFSWTEQGTTTGLPDYLFESSSEVTVTIVTTFATGDTLRGFFNALVLDSPVDTEKTVLYLTADDTIDPRLLDRIVTLPAGNVGFEMSRTVDEPAPWSRETMSVETAEQGLEQIYNLLGYQVAGNSAFDASPFGLPLTPIEPAPSGPVDPAEVVRVPIATGPATWTYSTAIPVFPFTKPATKKPTRTEKLAAVVVPPEADDPYRGVGKTARIALNFQDMFGNRIITAAGTPLDLDAPITYFDDLVGVDSWPSVVTSYQIATDAKLILNFAFDNDRYTGGGDDARTRVIADRQKYALIYYQISRNATIAATTTLDPSATLDLTSTLEDWVIAIYTYLTGLLDGPPPTPVPPIAPWTTVADTSGQSLFALVTDVTIARTAPVNADAASRLGGTAQSAVSSIRAKTQQKPPLADAGDDDPLTLAVFAEALESAFPALKVATGASKSSTDATSGRAVWLVRFSPQAGFRYDFQTPRYFAVPPLARTPISRGDVTVHVYGSDQPLPDQPTVVEAFVNVDMDQVARDLLTLIDLFLSPDYVVPAWRLVHGAQLVEDPIALLLDAKRAIATAIGAKLAPIYEADSRNTPAPATVDRLTQQLLITLAQAYEIDSVVEVPVTTVAPERVGLWGKPIVSQRQSGRANEPSAPTYSLSTAALAFTPGVSASVLPFTFTSRDKSAASVMALPIAYRVNALQHDLQPPFGGYVPSSWLSFVIPFTQTASTHVRAAMASGGTLDVEIPIPLRAFPAPPTMASQVGQSSDTGVIESLAEAKLWDYRFAYEYASAAQDRVHAEVSFNVSGRAPLPAAATPDLLDVLLQFQSAAPGLRRDLDANVLRKGNDAVGLVAIQSLQWIAQQAAGAWPAWTQPPVTRLVRRGRVVGDIVEPFDDQILIAEHAITVQEPPPPTPDVLEVTIARTGGTFVGALPLVDIDQWTAQPSPGTSPTASEAKWVFTQPGGVYLTFSQGRRILGRALRYQKLDILQDENATAGLSIGRNEDYGGRAGNEPFIYRTPEVRFVSNVTPLLVPDVDIDIAAFTPAPPPSTKLETYLRNFFDAFFTTASGAHAGDRLIRLGAAFEYDLNGFAVDVPIFLSLPLELSPSSATIAQIAGFVMDWFEDRALVGRAGRLRLELSLFASLSDANVPILRLGNLHLATDKIWEVTRADRLVAAPR